MATELVFSMEVEGFEEPILGRVRFDGFEDAVLALKKLGVFEDPFFCKLRFEGFKETLNVRTEPTR